MGVVYSDGVSKPVLVAEVHSPTNTPHDPDSNNIDNNDISNSEISNKNNNIERVITQLATMLRERRTLVLSGAGISTESGIPDYRGPSAKPRNPMRYQMFVNSATARQRYWARSTVGWAFVADRYPNAGHEAVTQLEAARFFTGVLTQNVDGLHQAAGSKHVLELHGRLSQVRCLQCQRLESRHRLQERMLEHNPTFKTYVVDVAPDGDAEIPDEHIHTFTVPACRYCGGVLKPDVVFFGENVPKPRVERAWQWLEDADALLVLGSSLTVRSGYRFVVHAAQENKPVLIINLGETRGDGDATFKVNAPLGETLRHLARHLGC